MPVDPECSHSSQHGANMKSPLKFVGCPYMSPKEISLGDLCGHPHAPMFAANSAIAATRCTMVGVPANDSKRGRISGDIPKRGRRFGGAPFSKRGIDFGAPLLGDIRGE